MARDPNSRVTCDLAVAGYMHMKGLRVLGARRVRNGYEFLFLDDGRFDQFRLDFANSEAQVFDASVRALKKLCSGGVAS